MRSTTRGAESSVCAPGGWGNFLKIGLREAKKISRGGGGIFDFAENSAPLSITLVDGCTN